MGLVLVLVWFFLLLLELLVLVILVDFEFLCLLLNPLALPHATPAKWVGIELIVLNWT